MQILLTRAAEDNAPLAARLRKAGHRVLEAPLLICAPLNAGPPPADDYQAIVFSSRHGVRHGAALVGDCSLPVFTVGARTAAAAREAGFTQVLSADGDGAALARLILGHCEARSGPLLHPAAKETRPGLRRALEGAGFRLDHLPVYDMKEAGHLPREAAALLHGGDIDLVLLYSPRAAGCFHGLALDVAGDQARKALMIAALSPAVAGAAAEGFGGAIVAAAPSERALLAAVRAHYGDGFLPEDGDDGSGG